MSVMEARVQRVLVWGGPGMLLVWLGAFLWIAGFIPPSAPLASPEQIVQFYGENTFGIRIGLVISMFGCALMVPYAVAVSGQLKRIDGAKALADTQIVSCALLSLEFITPIGIWMAVSYNFDNRAAELTFAIHEMGWILFMTVIWSLFIQLIAIGTAILIDRGETKVFPRWVGFINLWTAVLIIPAGTVLFFKDGPFAWNGLFGLYVPVFAFAVWFGSMAWCVHRNLTQHIRSASYAAPLSSLSVS
jgi:hypothetical protein